jgi:hypothetical protein
MKKLIIYGIIVAGMFCFMSIFLRALFNPKLDTLIPFFFSFLFLYGIINYSLEIIKTKSKCNR